MLLSLFERWGVDSSNPYLHTAGGAQVSAGETYIICHHHFFLTPQTARGTGVSV